MSHSSRNRPTVAGRVRSALGRARYGAVNAGEGVAARARNAAAGAAVQAAALAILFLAWVLLVIQVAPSQAASLVVSGVALAFSVYTFWWRDRQAPTIALVIDEGDADPTLNERPDGPYVKFTQRLVLENLGSVPCVVTGIDVPGNPYGDTWEWSVAIRGEFYDRIRDGGGASLAPREPTALIVEFELKVPFPDRPADHPHPFGDGEDPWAPRRIDVALRYAAGGRAVATRRSVRVSEDAGLAAFRFGLAEQWTRRKATNNPPLDDAF